MATRPHLRSVRNSPQAAAGGSRAADDGVHATDAHSRPHDQLAHIFIALCRVGRRLLQWRRRRGRRVNVSADNVTSVRAHRVRTHLTYPSHALRCRARLLTPRSLPPLLATDAQMAPLAGSATDFVCCCMPVSTRSALPLPCMPSGQYRRPQRCAVCGAREFLYKLPGIRHICVLAYRYLSYSLHECTEFDGYDDYCCVTPFLDTFFEGKRRGQDDVNLSFLKDEVRVKARRRSLH